MSAPTRAHARSRAAYEPGETWDEAFAPDGTPRPAYAAVIEALAERDLGGLAASVRALAEREGVEFGAGGARRPFPIDPVPRVIEAGEWEIVAAGLVQRTRALAAFLADAYGPRRIVDAGVVPERVIESAAYHEPDARGLELRPAGLLAGLDLVRGGDGKLRVLEDNARTPSGLEYALGARRAVDGALGDAVPEGRRDIRDAHRLIAAALGACAPAGAADPYVVLLSDGPGNSAWYEHRRLAERLNLPLVTPSDLSLRGRRLLATTGDAPPRPVDVVYRRTDEDRLRDADGRPNWLAELVLPAVRAGTLTVVNPPGSGLADDKLVHAYVEAMIGFYLAEEPLLRSVRTYDLGDPGQRVEALERLGELVVKPRDGYGGQGVVLCSRCSADELREVERRVRDEPDAYVAQEMVTLSTHPTVVEGSLRPRHVDLRPFVIGGGHASAVAPGGLTRVAFRDGEMVVNSSRDGGGKDTWVMA